MADEYAGLRSAYAAGSETNAQGYQIKQALHEVFTTFLAFVTVNESQEEKSGASYITIKPCIAQTDGQDNVLQMAEITKCPHSRYQHGNSAFIIDPVPGDIVIMQAPKSDSTTIVKGTTEPQRPGSLRTFNQSNSLMTLGSVLTKEPENWMVLRQDKTRDSYSPEGIHDKTDKDYTLEVGQNLTITVGKDETLTITGNFKGTIQGTADLTVTGDITLTGKNNLTVNITGDTTINTTGNTNVTSQGDTSISTQGSTNVVTSGTTMIDSTGTATLKSAAEVTVQATSITLQAPSTTVTGNMTIAGSLSQGEGGGGNASFGGNIAAQGNISSQADVTASGISLSGHTHGGVEPGGGTTGGPQ